MPHTLILAYGNPLRGDDGIGPEAGERLRSIIQDSDVEIRTMHQLTPELMEPISRAARVLYGRAAEATMLTVAGAELSLGSGLSPAVAHSLDGVVAATMRLLDR